MACRWGCHDAALVIDKTLAHHLALPLHEAGSTRRARMPGWPGQGASELPEIAMPEIAMIA
jgi:hypothetical protein